MATQTHSTIRPAAGDRPRRLTLAAAWLGVTGLLAAFYAGIVPLLPPLVTTPAPLVATAIGGVGIVAAIGVWRVAAWGRWLGVAFLLLGIAQSAGYLLWRATTGSGTGSTPDPMLFPSVLQDLLSWAMTLAVVWVLLRRWPSAAE
jgi:hypothetical protein